MVSALILGVRFDPWSASRIAAVIVDCVVVVSPAKGGKGWKRGKRKRGGR